MFRTVLSICIAGIITGCTTNSNDIELSVNEKGETAPKNLIEFIDNGGWCWFQDERAIMHDGKLVVGAIAGKGPGDVRVATYDMNAKKHLGTTVLHADFERDDHNAPVFCARPDGRILTVYEEHFKNHDPHHYFRLSSPNDTTKWDEVYTYSHGRGQWVTYANLYYLPAKKRMYNFFRDGRVYSPHFIYSDDLGKTWSERIKFIDDGNPKHRQRPYARYCTNSKDTVFISFTEGHPRLCNNSVFFAKFKDGKFYKEDGTYIKDLKKDGPLTPQEATLIYKGSRRDNRGWTSSIRLDENENPVIGYTNYISNEDHRYFYARWDGKKWHDYEVAYGGSCFWKHESDYTGLITIDPTDVNTIYVSTNVDPQTGKQVGTGKHEIYKGVTADFGKSWQWTPITANSTRDNIRPVVVPSDGENYALLWLRGSFPSFLEYDLDVVGIVKPLK